MYKASEWLDAEEERYFKATRVAEAYGFDDSDEDLEQKDSEGSGAAGAGPSELAPPTQVTPKLAKTKRKTTPKSTGRAQKKRTNAKGEEDGFNLCEKTVEDI